MVGIWNARFSLSNTVFNAKKQKLAHKPLVVSTWDSGLPVNKAAWKILRESQGKAIDAVEAAARSIEADISCCVGLGANPDRDGRVTLDACIMDEKANCGSVAFLENIKHPISVARKVMETTPHVMLVGEGALQFALANGFKKESGKLSPEAEKAYKNWLKKSAYKPTLNIERQQVKRRKMPSGGGNSIPPQYLEDGSFNHDTMGTIALDAAGNLSGACTTSGMAYKMRGRLGDSPIIGAGLFVDNEIGACVATGQCEEVIRVAGAHLVVEMMRLGKNPTEACKIACERIVKINPDKAKNFQVGFVAINKSGEYGAFAVNKGFNYAVTFTDEGGKVHDSEYLLR
ncbi:MAG: N(4)-(beta-N-acetylglucosaminyl)-L-asparaginase [Saprospiraceae bacterium]|nr:N(4)-(beta-N-acetylglucosaminyl)-L-asparaginase [Saprospiraceae bacterium]